MAETTSNLQQEINRAKSLQESYDSLADEKTALNGLTEDYGVLAQAAEAYNTGKVQLAQNITAKGVEASATETLPELAQKVTRISQETYEIEGGEIYGAQIQGSLSSPNYWNLYEILTQLLSDGRLVQYGGILLGEYYRGYDSIALSGAGAGGAYVVSDRDELGNFKMYTEDITHVWNPEFDGKGNRWVAYCFAEEYHDFNIADTNTSPRSIFVGRKVGVIRCIVNSRIANIVVPDGNVLNQFFMDDKSGNFGRVAVIRNLQKIGKRTINIANTELLYIAAEELNTGSNGSSNIYPLILNSGSVHTIFLSIKHSSGTGRNAITTQYCNYTELIISDLETCSAEITLATREGQLYDYISNPNLKDIYIVNSESLRLTFWADSTDIPKCENLYFGYKTNDKTKSFIVNPRTANGTAINNIVLQNGWCKPITVSSLWKLTEENMYAHILQRLKQDEPDCGAGVTITLGSTNLARLTSEESVALLDELTNTYGYTFA